MLNYVAGVFVLFFCMDVYYFLRMLVVLVVAAIRPKRPGMRLIRVLLLCRPQLSEELGLSFLQAD